MGERRIRLVQSVAGLDFSWPAGHEVDLPEEEAAKWADGQRAVYVDADAGVSDNQGDGGGGETDQGGGDDDGTATGADGRADDGAQESAEVPADGGDAGRSGAAAATGEVTDAKPPAKSPAKRAGRARR
jgi:hypothetical protein